MWLKYEHTLHKLLSLHNYVVQVYIYSNLTLKMISKAISLKQSYMLCFSCFSCSSQFLEQDNHSTCQLTHSLSFGLVHGVCKLWMISDGSIIHMTTSYQIIQNAKGELFFIHSFYKKVGKITLNNVSNGLSYFKYMKLGWNQIKGMIKSMYVANT